MNQPNQYYNPYGNNQFGGYYQPPLNPMDIEKQRKRQLKSNERSEILTAGLVLGAAIIGYLFMQTVALEMLKTLGLKQAYDSSSAFQYLFNVLAVHIFSMLLPFGIAALILKKRFVTPVVPTKKVGTLPFWAWVSFGMAACYFANIFVTFIMALVKQFGYELTKSEYKGPSSVFDCIAMVVSVILIPAIIEELAMRCFSLGALAKHGKGFAVFGVSVVFGLLHGNVIQFLFAFLIGVILGYVTVKTESVLPAMLIHGCNNGLSVIQDVLNYATNKDLSVTIINIIFVAWLILGILGFIYLVYTKQFLPKKDKNKEKPLNNFFVRILCLLPGMALPIAILVYLSYKTIVKI